MILSQNGTKRWSLRSASTNNLIKIEQYAEIIESDQYEQIKRSMKGLLNRLSDSTLESTLQKIVLLYRDPKNSFNALNHILCSTIFDITVSHKQLLESLASLNACLIVGLHNVLGKNVGAFVLEKVVMKYNEVKHDKLSVTLSDEHALEKEGGSINSKAGSNLILMLCYFYNFHMSHCILIYDIIRNLIRSFKEIDVEVLLLILNHAGKELRSDDPSALKDIVFLAKERAVEILDTEGADNNKTNDYVLDDVARSRIQFMLDAMQDLKNNNIGKQALIQSKQSLHMEDRIKNYRKILGRVKSSKSNKDGFDGSCLRISLQDIIDIPTKGRWWKTGASWVGHQHSSSSTFAAKSLDANNNESRSKCTDQEQNKLLRMANAAHMNTDLRKSIFCIVMSSADCEDCFTRLMRQQIIASNYQEVGRVLIECCMREKSYNPFYSHLCLRICDFQKKMKRAVDKLISDILQRFYDNADKNSARQSANLAKLSSHLLITGVMRLKVLENVFLEYETFDEVGPDSSVVIYLVMLFQTLFESMEDKEATKKMFAPRRIINNTNETDEEIGLIERDEELRRSISLFILKYLSDSPQNSKGSTFQRNFRIAIKCGETEILN